MLEKLNANETNFVIGGSNDINDLHFFYEDLKDMEIESSKKRFEVLRSSAADSFGKNNFLELIDHSVHKVYYVRLSDANNFIFCFNNNLR